MTLKALEGSLESRNCQSLLILLSVQLVRYFLRETVILICKEAFLSGSKKAEDLFLITANYTSY